ncbi:cupin domain-containing protein [Demequina sp. SYSU T00039]|uniref:Cupin domain-containing protein n=1 Tax=Demequina lignilytica TaxID=3051663 RepID=A0AAW7M9R6_9MICO|nr:MULTISPECIES: cupin domain-containing protein [unclassified Demequina]MDN4478920.1 cupin domain-containing protein [Demequina sp. SYSU T00039-1]MDN4488795.1 cupin domain-containing protein [Demequina sp. SYSU T00039]MDN4491821.1 cupin domain-containing protein [Demequina sp. SYSU T00068]
MTDIAPGAAVDLTALPIETEPVPDDALEAGAPVHGAAALAEIGAVEIGVWEMTPGVATDVEVDEVFVVLAGRARIEYLEPALPPAEVGPGSLVWLQAGMRTRWTVTETLRKVYVAP